MLKLFKLNRHWLANEELIKVRSNFLWIRIGGKKNYEIQKENKIKSNKIINLCDSATYPNSTIVLLLFGAEHFTISFIDFYFTAKLFTFFFVSNIKMFVLAKTEW